MNIQKLGAAQRGLFVQPGAGSTAQPAGASAPANASPAGVPPTTAARRGLDRAGAASGAREADPTADGAPRAGLRRRIEGFVEHADRRLDNLLRQPGLTQRQQDALRAAQETFHAQMGRLDRALDGGAANSAMHNILAGLRGSIDAILHEGATETDAGAASAASKPGTIGSTIQPGGSANQIDTLA